MRHSGRIAVLDSNDIDTDRIIPARFLSMVTKSGFGELLFNDVRGSDFPLDQPEAVGASILIVGSNFGCGSSREHAVWAIQQAGFRCVVGKATDSSPAFSDIFRQNAANCGLLLAELSEADHSKLVASGSGAEVTVDLPQQTIETPAGAYRFTLNPATKDALIKGLDLIGTTLELESEISRYESEMGAYVPGRST